MQVQISNPQFQTLIFGIFFGLAIILSIKKSSDEMLFAPSRTEELKGFAILAIVFSHIGYFLSTNDKFLWPFSILAGVGVNLFLFLSGFGLTISSLKKPISILDFYVKRLRKLLIPFWIVVITFLLLDYFWLHKSYPFTYIWQSLVGFFPTGDPFADIDSPLWYFTIILFYYILFPLVFFKRLRYLSPVIIYGLSYFLLKQNLPIKSDVINLYSLHTLSFPLGIFFALFRSDPKFIQVRIWFRKIFLEKHFKYIFILLFTGIFAYTAVRSGVGESKNIEQTVSLVTMFSIIFVFIAKDWEFRLLNLFGKYSYEIYLFHWPLLIRYDYFYKYLPASLATILYMGLFVGLGIVLNKIATKLRA